MENDRQQNNRCVGLCDKKKYFKTRIRSIAKMISPQYSDLFRKRKAEMNIWMDRTTRIKAVENRWNGLKHDKSRELSHYFCCSNLD